ncbi:MAG: glycosyltransferase family 4 protein [Gomphosphaeria aponina SAG 52.96 = DSM 107014]|uniref:Glycosyltransferase family 4 protein n=1 Tax=Gomphosphaeria aponina SAG 52.96 = DSM 107014 TaxID=1521640 RepID=A0A941JRA4_9CHRO|nr:glycosyltransferase family 4 protein [Gomphosphaeria aponina SAG 52.96 = DSM 107014]
MNNQPLTINHQPLTINHVFVFLEIFAQEGGIQSYVKDVLQAYSSFNLRSEIFLLRDAAGGENTWENELIKFHYLKSKFPWQGRLKLAWLLFNCLSKRRPQHVFCGHIKLVVLVNILCKSLGIPYTVLTYGKEVWETLPELEKQALQKAACIWTISRYSRDRLCAANQIPSEKVKILPCVVNGNIFTPGAKPEKLIEQYGLKNAKVLMTVARLWSGDIYKGVDVTIRALPQIQATFPAVKYLVIGRGDDKPRLAQLAADLGVGESVIFAGFVPTEKLVEHYRLADIYVMPSQEGFGIVYLEAMACGIPVISGEGDGAADPLQDGRLGQGVPHRDPAAVAKACLEILRGNELRCNGNWLREETLKHFSQAALNEKLRNLLGFNG